MSDKDIKCSINVPIQLEEAVMKVAKRHHRNRTAQILVWIEEGLSRESKRRVK